MARIADIANSQVVKSMGDDFFDAFNAGREAEARFQGVTIGIWSAILDDNSCDYCSFADGKRFALSGPHPVPPAHFGCRCIIAYVNEEDLDPDELDEFELWEDPPDSVFPAGRKRNASS